MKPEDLTSFKKWFDGYVTSYYIDDPVRDQPIRLKQAHTERVCNEIVMLGRALHLPLEDLLLAETMALFHDVGRFQQYAAYGTFKDSASEDHAEIGTRELARHKVLSVCSDTEQSLITTAIRYHNVRTLPKDEDERGLFFACLLRDADKLDIFRVFIDYYESQDQDPNSTIVWSLPDKPVVSPKIIMALRERRMADLRDMATLCDFKMLQISWVFDLNFLPTFSAVYERGYVENIAAALPQTNETAEVVDIVVSFLAEKRSAPHVKKTGSVP